VAARRLDASNRVIYIADCTAWGAGTVLQHCRFLIQVIVFAFVNDKPILEACRQLWSLKDTDRLIEALELMLVEVIPRFCNDNKLQLLAVFDQHNGLPEAQRNQMPFQMVEHQLPSRWETGLVIVSASANNAYFLKVSYLMAQLVWQLNSTCS
jgi:hypothetical protein